MMYPSFRLILFLFFIWIVVLNTLHTPLVFARVIRVPFDYATISQAIEAAVDGDVIEVDANRGPYIGHLSIQKSITLMSINGRAILTTDPKERHNETVFIGGVKTARIEGFLVIAPEHPDPVSGLDVTNSFNVSVVNNIVQGSLSVTGSQAFGIFVTCQTCEILDNVVYDSRIGINVFQSQDVLVQGNRVEKNNIAFDIGSSASITVIKNTVIGNGAGIGLNNSDNSTVQENLIVDLREPRFGPGINLNSARGNKIAQNTVEGGIGFTPGSHNNVIQDNALTGDGAIIQLSLSNGNTISGNQLPVASRILLFGASDNVISDNVFDQTAGGGGIVLNKGSDHNVIRNNHLKRIPDRGIVLNASNHNLVQANDLVNVVSTGIEAIGPLTTNTISDNNITFNAPEGGNIGIYLKNATAHTIQNNSIRIASHVFKDGYGILLETSNDNTIGSNTADNFNTGLSLNDSNDNDIQSNTFSDGRVDGIQLIRSSNNQLQGNRIKGFGVSGISLLEISSGNTIEQNDVAESGFGIRLAHSSNNTLQHNLVEGNAGVGINLWIASDRNRIADNIITENGEGVTLKSNQDNRLEGNLISDNNVGASAGEVTSLVVLQNTFLSNALIHLFVFNSSGIVIEDNAFGKGVDGAVLSASTNSQIRSNLFSELVNGMSLEASSNIQIENNAFFQNDTALTFKRDLLDRANAVPALLDHIDVRQNIFEQNRLGIWIPERAAFGSGIALRENNFLKNHEFGVLNESSQPLDAAQNWWGDETGPSSSGAGQGDAVSNGVTFDPWLSEAIPLTRPLAPQLPPERDRNAINQDMLEASATLRRSK